MHILDILQELKAQTGKGSAGRKISILEEQEDNKLLKNFFFWALDPQFNYWQSKITKGNHDESVEGDVDLLHAMAVVMDKIVTRKVTGNNAKRLLTNLYYDCVHKDANLLERIITGKPDVGFNVGTVNKVWPGLIYDPSYMRCKSYSPKAVGSWDFENEVIYSNLKCDGMFNNIILADIIKLETRSGESLQLVVDSLSTGILNGLEILRSDLSDKGVIDPVLHGEFLVIKDGEIIERSKGNGLINKVKLGGKFPTDHYLRIVIWDYIPLENFLSHEEYPVTYDKKFDELKSIFGTKVHDEIQLIEYKRVYSMMDAQRHFVEQLQAGFEGTVLKNASRLTWKNHDSPNQLKLKNKFRFEMRVIGFTKGEGKYASTFGSMIIESECGKLKSAISGMTDKIRNEIHDNRELYIDAVVEVEANGLFKNNDGTISLMHPRNKELREDKTSADTQERIIQQEIDSIMGTRMENDRI